MQKPRKRFLSAIVAVAMCLSQFAPVTAYAVESASGITQSEEAPKETDALSTTTTNSDSSATTPAPKSDVTDTASSASSDTSVTSDVSSEATSQAGSETTTAYANSAASDTGASTSTSSEASTTGSISEAAQAFIDAANALVSRKDEILTAANNFGLASKAWQADKENAVLDAMVTRRTEELDAVYDWEPIEDMYYSLSEDEQVAEPVMNAYLDMSDLYLQVCDRQENPVDNSGASAFDGGGSTTVIGDYQAITAAETGKQIAAGTGIQYTKISGQENVIRILPQTVTYTYGDSFKSKGLTIEYSTADSRTPQEVEKDIQAAIDGLSFIMYAPADGDGQNPTDIHCNAGTYPTYVDTGATSVTVNGLNKTNNEHKSNAVALKEMLGLSGEPTVVLPSITSAPGGYTVTIGNIQTNAPINGYNINLATATFEITKRNVTITNDQIDAIYGEAEKGKSSTITFDAVAYNGAAQAVASDKRIVAGSDITADDGVNKLVSMVLTTQRQDIDNKNVGEYPMTVEVPPACTAYYDVKVINSKYIIHPAMLTVTLDDLSAMYGAARSGKIKSIEGFKLNDTQTSIGLTEDKLGFTMVDAAGNSGTPTTANVGEFVAF